MLAFLQLSIRMHVMLSPLVQQLIPFNSKSKPHSDIPLGSSYCSTSASAYFGVFSPYLPAPKPPDFQRIEVANFSIEPSAAVPPAIHDATIGDPQHNREY